jgi:hypothetical protein
LCANVALSLERHRCEQLRALEVAGAMSRRDLTGMLPGILLNAQLALQHKETPAQVCARLREICQIAQEVQLRLQPAKTSTLTRSTSAAS